jgi:hypothetical protein
MERKPASAALNNVAAAFFAGRVPATLSSPAVRITACFKKDLRNSQPSGGIAIAEELATMPRLIVMAGVVFALFALAPPRAATALPIVSDRKKRKNVDEIMVNLHGPGGDVDYQRSWNPRLGVPNVSGIAKGPAAFQERVRYTLVKFFDPQGRIKLPKQKRGAGW